MVAVFLARESRGLLVGERVNARVMQSVREVAEANADVERVDSLRTMHLGPNEVLLTAKIRFRAETSDLPAAIDELKQRFAEAEPLLSDMTIEPAAEASD